MSNLKEDEYLQSLSIDTKTLKKNLGQKCKYVLNGDVNPKNGNYNYRYGKIGEIIKRQVDLGNSDFISFNKIILLYVIKSKKDLNLNPHNIPEDIINYLDNRQLEKC